MATTERLEINESKETTFETRAHESVTIRLIRRNKPGQILWRAYLNSYGQPTHAKDWGATLLESKPLRDFDDSFVEAATAEDLVEKLSQMRFLTKKGN